MSLPEITLLGGITVRHDNADAQVVGPRQLALLAVLAVDVGRVLPAETAAERAWGELAPERLRATLQTNVWRLRTALGSDLIRTEPAGYRLVLPREQVDVHAIADLWVQARAADDPALERAMLRDGIERWTGDPFAGASSDWLTTVAATQIVDGYLRAVERRADLDLAAGEIDGLDTELRGLLDRYPLRESLWLRLLRALGSGGRAAEALQAYETVRLRLADELGADPSPELQDAHVALLSGSLGESVTGPSIAAASSAPPQSPRGRRVPRQLPADIPHFVGREPALAALDQMGRTNLVVLSGPAGSGKTSAAVHWSHQRAADFPDGQIFVNLRGFGVGKPTPAADALELVLRGLHVPGDRIPEGVEARSALLRSELAERRVLLVLDDAHDADHVRPLLPGGDTLVIVTSRNQLRGLVTREGAARIDIGPMSPDESVRLLRQRGELPAAASSGPRPETSLDELARQCGYLPLALAIASERAGRSAEDLGELVSELGDEQSRLDALATGEDPLSDLRGVFAISYRKLASDAARAFRFLGLHPSSVVSVGSMAALLDIAVRDTTRQLDRLVEANLLRRVRSGWFAVHDLLRIYAIELVTDSDPAEERAAADARLRSWCIHSAEAACLRLWRYPSAIEAGPLLVQEPERFDTPRRADAWFAAHRAALADLIDQAADDGDDLTVCRLVPRLVWYVIRIGAGDEHLAMCRLAAERARATGDLTHIGGAANNLGIAHAMQGHNEEAGTCFNESETAYSATGNWDHVSRTRNNIGALLHRTGETGAAIELLEAVLSEDRRRRIAVERCGTLQNLANACTTAGATDRAMQLASEILDVARAHGHVLYEAQGHGSVGTVHMAIGDHDSAAGSFGAAVSLRRRIGDRPALAESLKDLGEAEHAAGRDDSARRAWTEALDVLRSDGVTGRAAPLETIEELLADLPEPAR